MASEGAGDLVSVMGQRRGGVGGGEGGLGRRTGQERVPRLVADHGVALAWCPSSRRPGEERRGVAGVVWELGRRGES